MTNTKDNHAEEVLAQLKAIVAGHGPMVIAYSGGVDSGLLAYVAHQVLGDAMLAMLGVSPSLASDEADRAIAFLRRHDIPFETIQTHEMDEPRYRANGPDRCYFCKTELFTRIESSEAARRFSRVAYGANADDRFDHRPGARAATEHGVLAPLAEAGFSKTLVRSVAQFLGLELWDKPASPCLASRIPYHQDVTPAKLHQIDAAEAVLETRGFRVSRVRHHGVLARVEIPLQEHARVHSMWAEIVDALRNVGFERVELVADGFRSGRLNEDIRHAALTLSRTCDCIARTRPEEDST